VPFASGKQHQVFVLSYYLQKENYFTGWHFLYPLDAASPGETARLQEAAIILIRNKARIVLFMGTVLGSGLV
jgi:hypothetical protein